MKKVISLILVLVLFSSIALMTVHSETTETEYLFKDKFLEKFSISPEQLQNYNESIICTDANGNVDWAFITAYTYTYEEMFYTGIVADVIIRQNFCFYPFTTGECIYDVEKDEFFGIGYYEDYEGLEEYINENIGTPIGDANNDGKLSILDATYIQMALAQMCEFHESDTLISNSLPIKYVSDMDRDGKRTIMDATAIQFKLAKLDIPVATPDEA